MKHLPRFSALIALSFLALGGCGGIQASSSDAVLTSKSLKLGGKFFILNQPAGTVVTFGDLEVNEINGAFTFWSSDTVTGTGTISGTKVTLVYNGTSYAGSLSTSNTCQGFSLLSADGTKVLACALSSQFSQSSGHFGASGTWGGAFSNTTQLATIGLVAMNVGAASGSASNPNVDGIAVIPLPQQTGVTGVNWNAVAVPFAGYIDTGGNFTGNFVNLGKPVGSITGSVPVTVTPYGPDMVGKLPSTIPTLPKTVYVALGGINPPSQV